MSKSIHCDANTTYKTYLKNKIAFSFEFKTIATKDVENAIKQLKSKSSTGYDNLSTKLLNKQISPVISIALTNIINQSLCTGIFPNKLKIAKVLPLFKKGNPHVFGNYRPISLLPSISKIFEKTVYKQLYDYLISNKLLYKSQYGFRHGHSTELASLELTDRIMKDLDNKRIPIAIFLDLSKAFDTLDHEILLYKLKYYGVKNSALSWFQSYLSDRYQFVDYDGNTSAMLPISTGVPQGSILGPLLFLVYMNDINEVCKTFKSILYADDTTLAEPLCSFDVHIDRQPYNRDVISANINLELKQIHTWLSANKLSLNIPKTKFMIFHNKQRKIDNIVPNLVIDGHIIERVHDFNFLGLTIDQNMSWDPHINKISSKISRTLGTMNKLKNFLPTHVLKLIYNSLILPHLQYAILAWGFKLSRVFKLQKRAVRLITKSKYNSHTEPLFKSMNLLKVEDIFKFHALKLFHKSCSGNLPEYFSNMFTVNPRSHTYETRHRYSNIHQTSNTSSGSNCVRYFIPKLLSDIPQSIKDKIETHSLHGFSVYVKNYFIEQYTILCEIENCYVCSVNEIRDQS